MTGPQLREAQRVLGMKNHAMCERLGISEATLCNYKAGRWPVPKAVVLAVRYLLSQVAA